MKDPEILFREITNELTSPGQIFETRDYKDSKNISHNLGVFYYLSATQLLYAFKFYANS